MNTERIVLFMANPNFLYKYMYRFSPGCLRTGTNTVTEIQPVSNPNDIKNFYANKVGAKKKGPQVCNTVIYYLKGDTAQMLFSIRFFEKSSGVMSWISSSSIGKDVKRMLSIQ